MLQYSDTSGLMRPCALSNTGRVVATRFCLHGNASPPLHFISAPSKACRRDWSNISLPFLGFLAYCFRHCHPGRKSAQNSSRRAVVPVLRRLGCSSGWRTARKALGGEWRPLAEGTDSFEDVDVPLRIAVYPPRAGARCVALVKGEVKGCERVPARVHSECMFGDSFGSTRCDCGPQLRSFMRDVLGDASVTCGVLLYLNGHEGKGIGLENKLRAYALQDGPLQLSERDANQHLGFKPDLRRYGSVRAALRHLGIRSVVLHTDSRRKASALGKSVVGTVAWSRVARKWNTMEDFQMSAFD